MSTTQKVGLLEDSTIGSKRQIKLVSFQPLPQVVDIGKVVMPLPNPQIVFIEGFSRLFMRKYHMMIVTWVDNGSKAQPDLPADTIRVIEYLKRLGKQCPD